MTNLDEKRREVQHAFEAALKWADSGERRPFFAFEKELWTLLLAAGRALTVLFLARQVARARAVQYRFEGRAFSTSDKHRTTGRGRWRLRPTRYSRIPPGGRMPGGASVRGAGACNGHRMHG